MCSEWVHCLEAESLWSKLTLGNWGLLRNGETWFKIQHSENKDHVIWSHHFMANRWGNSVNSVRLFFGAPNSLQMMTAVMKLKDAYSLKGKL